MAYSGVEPGRNLTNSQFEDAKIGSLYHTFFLKSQLEQILNREDFVGIKMYPARNEETDVIIAAGVTKFKHDEPGPYLLGSDRLENAGIWVEDIHIATQHALQQETLKDTILSTPEEIPENSHYRIELFNVYFSRQALQQVMDVNDCFAIGFYYSRFLVSDWSGEYLTLTAVPVNESGEALTIASDEGEGFALMSPMPCPPDCGETYLNPHRLLDHIENSSSA